MTNRVRFLAYSTALLLVGFVAGNLTNRAIVQAQAANRVFELRTYTAPEGKLSDLHKRFRDHTMRIFQKHGMTNIGYWQPQDEPRAANTLIYIVSHASREAAAANWKAFGADPEWKKVSAESQVNGRIVEKVDSVFMNATDYSPIK
jgi:hypothetical protein